MTLNRRTLLKSAGFVSLAAATGAQWSALAAPIITVAYSQAGLLNDWRVINQKDMETSIKGAGWNFITANADSDPAKQLSDVQSLLAQRPTVLVLAPQESAALAPAVDMCNDAGIPLLVIDRTLAAEPGKGMYKAEIVQSHFNSGVLLAQKALELLKKKNGAPKGNVVRVMGFPGASTVIDPGNGWKSVMKDCPDIKVVGQGNGQYNENSAIKVMQDLLQRFPKGQIDVVWSDYSDMTMGAIEVIKTAGRDELLGYIVDEGGHKLSIEAVIKGEIARDTQTPPYFGKEVVENVKKLVAGEPVEPKQPLKIKVFEFGQAGRGEGVSCGDHGEGAEFLMDLTSQAPAALALNKVGKSFGPVNVLKGVSCEFRGGEVHCLVGENGAGKSTLIRIASGAHRADSGTVSLAGVEVEKYSPHIARERGVATIYQELDLIPNLNGAENIYLGVEPRKRFGRIDKEKLHRDALAILAGMKVSVDIGRPVQELGIAQQQMIAIAKALSRKCRLLILDEPTAVFTSTETRTLFDLIGHMRTEEIAIVFISHHMDEIFEIGDRVTVLRDGLVVSAGPIDDYDHDRLVRDMVGRQVVRQHRRAPSGGGEPLLEVKGLSDGKMVRDVSFNVRKGEIVGMAGLIGSGRTEAARLIFGAESAKAGEVRLGGIVMTPSSPFEAIRLGIGMVPEDRKRDGLVLMRSVGENAGYTLACKLSRAGLVPWSKIRREVGKQIAAVSVKPANVRAQVGRLSGGNQQKVMLSRWLAAGVSLLILDEPTRGVDIGARSEIYEVMRSLADQGMGILLISSDLPEVLSQSDRIVVMAKGRSVGELSGEEATEEAVMALAFRPNAGARV